jgi:hypothetical protein
MTTTKERVEGHYEVQEVPYGKVYKWTPGHAVVECECGQLMLVDAATTAATCPTCGAEHDASAVEGLEGNKPLVEQEAYNPEHRAYEEWQREQEAHPYLKRYEWLELQAL